MDGSGRFPFGRPATIGPPRSAASGSARVFVLGVYPGALHVRWACPDGKVHVQSLAVDDEPEVFWDGADATERVERWKQQVGWQRSWGSATSSGNGTSGRGVQHDVLAPLGISPGEASFTDCFRRYLVKSGPGSQGAAMERAYTPFAAARGLPPVSLPQRPSDAALVRMAHDEDRGEMVAQLRASGADLVVTLGQPAADVLADLVGHDRVVLRRDETYAEQRTIRAGSRPIAWLPLKHLASVNPCGSSTIRIGPGASETGDAAVAGETSAPLGSAAEVHAEGLGVSAGNAPGLTILVRAWS